MSERMTVKSAATIKIESLSFEVYCHDIIDHANGSITAYFEQSHALGQTALAACGGRFNVLVGNADVWFRFSAVVETVEGMLNLRNGVTSGCSMRMTGCRDFKRYIKYGNAIEDSKLLIIDVKVSD